MPKIPMSQAAAKYDRDPRTFRRYINKGFFPAYKKPGVREVYVDTDEVDRALRVIPARKAHAGMGSWSPQAQIKPMPVEAEVVTKDGDQ